MLTSLFTRIIIFFGLQLLDREDALEYADVRSEGSYHPPKVAEENVVPVPIPEPTLLAVDQSCPPSDQENIPPHAITLPLLNVLVPTSRAMAGD